MRYPTDYDEEERGAPSPHPASTYFMPHQNEPSTVRFLANTRDIYDSFERHLGGWVQTFDENGNKTWKKVQEPLCNERGRAWLRASLELSTSRIMTLSNFNEARIRAATWTEGLVVADHLAKNMNEYGITLGSIDQIFHLYLKIAESAFRRTLNDAERKHIFGSVQETSTPQDNKIFGVFPRLW